MSKIYDGSTCIGAEALYNGEAITLYSDTGMLSGYGEGDVVFFTTDAEGYLKSIHKIYDKDTGANTAAAAFAAMPQGAYKTDDWDFTFAKTTKDIQLVSGYVTEVKNNSITLGVVTNDATYGNVINGNVYNKADGSEGMFTFGIESGVQAIVFDEAYDVNQASKKYAVVDASAIVESNLVEVLDSNGDEVDYVYSVANSNLNDAMALVVNGDVVCIFVNYPV